MLREPEGRNVYKGAATRQGNQRVGLERHDTEDTNMSNFYLITTPSQRVVQSEAESPWARGSAQHRGD